MDKELQERIQHLIKQSFIGVFLKEDTITDISYNGTTMYVQDNKKGRYKTDKQPSDDDVMSLGKRIADEMGKEFTTNNPILDTELSYLRVNFIHSAVSPSGCTFAIRISKPILAMTDLSEVANEEVEQLLNVLIQGDINTIVAGETGTGKTELQKYLTSFIPDNKKITLIEDTMDSHIKALYPEKDINSWQTLMEDTRENKINFNSLIQAGLRNNPNWLIIAETRGSEAYDMLESALTGHSIITTIHAEDAKGIPSRIMTMIGQRYQMNEYLLGKDIVNVLKIGIHMASETTDEGIRRYIDEIVEYTGFNDNGIEYRTIYKVSKDYDEQKKEYKKIVELNPLSEDTLRKLKEKELYHLLPYPFIKEEAKLGLASGVSV